MSTRERVRDAIHGGRLDEVEELVAAEPRCLRYLMALTYEPEGEIRHTAARGIALACRHHPDKIQEMVRRLVWAMNDESGTHAVTAPDVVLAIAEENPDLLLPMVPDLIRLAADESLSEGLTAALSIVTQRCPGKVGKGLQEELNKRIDGKGDMPCRRK